jgi:hypothetical protein
MSAQKSKPSFHVNIPEAGLASLLSTIFEANPWETYRCVRSATMFIDLIAYGIQTIKNVWQKDH